MRLAVSVRGHPELRVGVQGEVGLQVAAQRQHPVPDGLALGLREGRLAAEDLRARIATGARP